MICNISTLWEYKEDKCRGILVRHVNVSEEKKRIEPCTNRNGKGKKEKSIDPTNQITIKNK